MTEEMKKRLGEVICIAPWTVLNLGCDEKEKRKTERRKVEYKVRTEQVRILE